MTTIANAAIYFHPEAYSTSGPKLMGRNAAGESFLRGFFAHSQAQEFWAQLFSAEHAQAFNALVRQAARREPVRTVDKNNLAALAQAGAVYHPGPGLGEHAWQRAAFGHAAWSLCGITHTTASASAMDAITGLTTAPVQPWDALICTSTAVKDNVQRLLQGQVDYLAQRLGVQRLVLPQLPVIPLGIHCADFAFSAEQRSRARAALGVDEQTLVVLFMGRLSFHAKAHPLAMYQALQQAAQTLPAGHKLLLVECGWHANQPIAQAYADAAQAACPSVRVANLDGRKAADRQTAWAGADVFCSLSDNIQETFGIVPIEAMATGLPVVVSDWDGYRDTVRDGVDGFRVPTLMPAAGYGADLALRHALEIDTYDMYCGLACSLVAVDIAATAEAFRRLFASAELRRQMGAAGRERATSLYDWSAIIPRYEALWSQLAELRLAQGQPVPAAWPARPDPFAGFANYPTAQLAQDSVFALARPDAAAALARWRALAMVDFAQYVLPGEAECAAILAALAQGEQRAGELAKAVPSARQPYVLRGLAWLLKLGVIKRC